MSDETTQEMDFSVWRRGRVWFWGDPHLGHERIIQLCDRPFSSVGHMNRVLIDNVNDRVSRHETLVVLGDLALGKLEETLKLLKLIKAKRIWVVPGNHDRWSLAYGHRGSVEAVRTKRNLWRAQYEYYHPGLRCEPDRQPSQWSVYLGGREVLVSHYPYSGDSRADGDRYGWLRPVDRGLPLIHGHVHTRWRTRGPMYNVGVDANDFAPIAESELIQWLNTVPVGGVVEGQQHAR